MTDLSRSTVDRIADMMYDGLLAAFGEGVELGLLGTFSDNDVNNRVLPVRALQVTFSGDLSDCVIGLTSMRLEPARSAMTAAALEITKSIGVPAEITPPEVHEFNEREDALEQMEALIGEPTVHFMTPVGELIVIMGSGLVRSADLVFNPSRAPATTSVGDEFAELGIISEIPPLGGSEEFVSSGAPAAGPVSASEVERAPEYFSVPAASSAAHAQTAAENEAAAALDEGALTWSNLLSGVEVELSAELGRASMGLGDVASMDADSVITLDQPVEEPIKVFVNGSEYATARLVVVDGEYGIEIVEVLETEALRSQIAA